MNRVQKTVLWTLAVGVFSYIAAHVLVVKAPNSALAQQPATDPSGSVPLPEDPLGGLGEERAAPAPALQTARALVAVCVGDKGEPLDGVIVDIFRETPTESPFDPRVEPYGRATSKDGGRLSFALPPIRHRITGQAGIYILYLTAPGRPIKAVVVENDTALPKKITIPKESAEHVYAPTHHIVVAKTKGISISPLHSAIRAFTKEGKIYRVVEFVDERTGDDKAPGKQTASGSWKPSPANPEDDVASMTASGSGGRMAGGLAGMPPPAAQDRITTARKKLIDARTDKDKQAARGQLRKLLAEIFAQDMQMREQQAAEIESRLAKLRQQYQAREKVRDEIIDLQLKVIEQDAAGLGFPGGKSFVPTPASGAGGSKLRGGGLLTPPTSDNSMAGGFVAPARRADTHDPIPKGRTLEDVKKSDPAAVAAMKDRGHFVESADGKLYAYANVNFPKGPSILRVVDSATGKLLGNTAVHSVVGPLQFTDDGVVSREGEELKLRIPLRRRKGPDDDVYEPAAASLNPFDPTAAALDPELLKKYSPDAQTRVGELSAQGHFVGSSDGKLYAYVESGGDNLPAGAAEIRICDARTGRRLGAAIVKAPVGKLKFAQDGVAIELEDGTIIAFTTEHGTEDVLVPMTTIEPSFETIPSAKTKGR